MTPRRIKRYLVNRDELRTQIEPVEISVPEYSKVRSVHVEGTSVVVYVEEPHGATHKRTVRLIGVRPDEAFSLPANHAFVGHVRFADSVGLHIYDVSSD